ncbi:TonB-dependent receptor domain-containing protein [Candidatus Pelagadaptatus aseana]|uniref:TonB-dependent receptor domain-containing protein n=1 Tax=Candidatus Pelagadaptatus aseana TaxID=3120508 RepID=UPI003C70287A
MDEANISPRASIHFQIAPQHTLRASASKVYRSPSIAEAKREQRYQAGAYVDYHLIGDDDLAAEELNELQLAYFGSFFDGKLSIDWRAFHEDMEGAIDHMKWEIPHQGWSPAMEPLANGKAYFFTNNKDWQVSGYDIQITAKPIDNTAIYFQHTNSRVDAWRQTDWDEYEGRRRFHEVPEHVTSVLLTHKLDSGWTFAAMGYRQNFTNWRGGSDIDRFRRFDVSISKNLSINEYQIDLNLKVENVTDDEYQEYQDGNFFRRSAYFNAALRW